jgi:hypothetical protein
MSAAGRDGSRSTLVSELTVLYRDVMDPSALSLAVWWPTPV